MAAIHTYIYIYIYYNNYIYKYTPVHFFTTNALFLCVCVRTNQPCIYIGILAVKGLGTGRHGRSPEATKFSGHSSVFDRGNVVQLPPSKPGKEPIHASPTQLEFRNEMSIRRFVCHHLQHPSPDVFSARTSDLTLWQVSRNSAGKEGVEKLQSGKAT